MRKPRPGGALLSTCLAALAAATAATPAAAASPEHFGPFHDTTDFVADCGAFEATVVGPATTSFTVWSGADGEPQKILMRSNVPHDLWTNTSTGASIVVRGHFTQTMERVAGDEWRVTVRGFRYLVNQPGEGVILADVGRIVYGNLAEDQILTAAGRHDLALPDIVEPAICEAIA